MNESTTPGPKTAPGDIPSSLYRRVAWRLLPIISICYAVAILDRVNISFAALKMSTDIHLSAAAYGLGAGIFFIAYCLLEMPSNIILARIGAKAWITRIMVSWGIVMIATGFIQDTTQFYIARVLLGVAEAGFYPGLVFFLGQWFPQKRLAQALSLMVIAGPAASIFVGPLSGWILAAFANTGGLAGWRWLFILQGIPAIVLGVVFFFAVANSPAKAPWLTDGEKAVLTAAIDPSGPQHTPPFAQLRDAFSNPKAWAAGFVLGTTYLGIYAVTFWVPTILASAGIKDVTAIGYLAAIPWVLAVAATILLGRYADRHQRPGRALVASLVVAAAGLILSVSFGNSLAPVLAGLSIAAALFTAAGPVLWVIARGHLKGAAGAAAAIALVNSFASLGSFAGPYLMGLVKDLTGSTVPALIAIAVIALAGAGVALLLTARRAHPAGQELAEAAGAEL
ncbi:MFS transporter [Sinomonas atrocyanea]|uniref:MFS transporter n=1 Tax=Sinomonas atrocyanea TaxID=37927 RepID=A0A126ZUE3_9MICC|nr:MFS transporter [Sinomonas atrocyanea]AMM30778.1 MFS transporter [Sinomonas atrocyanea]GEB63824.1 MFS transporter [Sinomonas atrocyanea]GGG65136.1 MFS transporter [Sinomonas atrocyanea]